MICCRQRWSLTTKQRLIDARAEADRFGRDTVSSLHVWNDAADAAFTEVEAIARISPKCARRYN